MKILCECGQHVIDSTDHLPNKAHLLPDKALEPLTEALDALIENPGRTAHAREGACMNMRELLGRAMRSVWQCHACGRLLVEDARRQVHFFAPTHPDTPTHLLDT